MALPAQRLLLVSKVLCWQRRPRLARASCSCLKVYSTSWCGDSIATEVINYYQTYNDFATKRKG